MTNKMIRKQWCPQCGGDLVEESNFFACTTCEQMFPKPVHRGI